MTFRSIVPGGPPPRVVAGRGPLAPWPREAVACHDPDRRRRWRPLGVSGGGRPPPRRPGHRCRRQHGRAHHRKYGPDREGARQPAQAVDALVPPNPEAAKEVSRLHGYLTRNAHRLDYPSFLDRKLPIGSGLVEAEVKGVVNQRAKRSGMRWTVPGTRAVLALRALVLSAAACLQRFGATQPQAPACRSTCSQDQGWPPDATRTGCPLDALIRLDARAAVKRWPELPEARPGLRER